MYFKRTGEDFVCKNPKIMNFKESSLKPVNKINVFIDNTLQNMR